MEGSGDPKERRGEVPTKNRENSLAYNFQSHDPVNYAWECVIRTIATGGYDADILKSYITAMNQIVHGPAIEKRDEWKKVEEDHGTMFDEDGFSRMSREHFFDALDAIREICMAQGIVGRERAEEEADVLQLKDMFEER